MSRELQVTAEPTTAMVLQTQWISGEGEDERTSAEVKFELTAGAGVGSSLLILTVDFKGKHVREAVDIRELTEKWVELIVQDVKKGVIT